ncbi:MAG: hypothetical protein K5696_00755 [Lachnospiraceae bacterium]|nr:hypothetical protein [Lachnospiraceae bacterium]
MKKNKTAVFMISIVVNILLALLLLVTGLEAGEKLHFIYVEEDTIRPDGLRSYLERENYGVAASLSHPIRGGAEVADEYLDYYMLGEYADLLFQKEIFAEAGNTGTVNSFENRLEEIRREMPDDVTLFDKIDLSARNAIRK